MRALYVLARGSALNPFDDLSVVWTARTTYDAVTLGWAASRAKHLAELRAALGLK